MKFKNKKENIVWLYFFLVDRPNRKVTTILNRLRECKIKRHPKGKKPTYIGKVGIIIIKFAT